MPCSVKDGSRQHPQGSSAGLQSDSDVAGCAAWIRYCGTVYFGPLGLCFRFGVANSWNEKMAKAVSGIMITAPKIQMRGANVRPMTITAKRTVKRFAFI